LISVLKAVLFVNAVAFIDIVAIWALPSYYKNDTERWIPGLPASERNITNSKKKFFWAEVVLRLAEFSQLEKYLAKQTRKKIKFTRS
jgi:hypothetical protein